MLSSNDMSGSTYPENAIETVPINLDKQQISQAEREELIQEAKNIKKHFDEFESDFKDPTKEYFYLVSVRWLTLWKHHVSFENVTEDKEPFPIYFGKVDLPELNSDIVVDNTKLIKYPDEAHYCNVQLIPAATIDRDYKLVTEEAWDIFIKKYRGITVKRPVRTQADGFRKVEAHLRMFNFIPFNNSLLRVIDHGKCTEFKPYQIQVPSHYTLKEFMNDLGQITTSEAAKRLFESNSSLSYLPVTYGADSLRLWKLDPSYDLTKIWKYFKEETNASRSYDYRIEFKGTFLSADMDAKIEDAQISDNDIIFLEARDTGKGWNLLGEGAPAIDKCEFCSKYEILPYPCGCKKVAYCSEDCKIRDKKFHMQRCEKASEEEEEKEKNVQESENSRKGIVGLQNLGNTCFMNGGLQCMLNLKELSLYFLANKFNSEINETNPLGTKGKLVQKYATLVKNIWYGTNSIYSPWALKEALSKFAPMFSGYQQHDSQEFLAYLIDGIHEDLNRVKNKPIVESVESENQPDYDVALRSWENHLKRNQSVIVDLIHGQYKSTIVCPECSRISITFDPFNCVSLPIPAKKEKEIDFFFLHGNNSSRPIKMVLKFPSETQTVQQLKEETARLLKKDPKYFFFAFAGHSSKETVENEEKTLTKVLRKKRKIKNLFAFEIPEEDRDETDRIAIDISTTKKASNYFGNVVHKTHTFIRTIYAKKTDTIRQVYLKVWKYYKFMFEEAKEESEREAFKALSDEETFKKVWEDADQKPFMLHITTNTKGFQECWFCGDRRCENCELQYNPEMKLSEILDKIKDKDFNFELEVYFGNLPDDVDMGKLNSYVDFSKEQEETSKEKEAAKNQEISVYDCFELFSVPEQLGEDNEWYCNKCKKHQRAKKQMEIYKAPPILMVHLKRFKAGNQSILSKGKIGHRIDFPVNDLDIGKYVLNHALPQEYPIAKIKPVFNTPSDSSTNTDSTNNTTPNPQDGAMPIEEATPQQIYEVGPSKGSEEIKSPDGTLKYDLFGVVNHFGNMGFGHYTAYGKNHIDGKWYNFDDSSVHQEDASSVCTPASYVLFYRRKDWTLNY